MDDGHSEGSLAVGVVAEGLALADADGGLERDRLFVDGARRDDEGSQG